MVEMLPTERQFVKFVAGVLSKLRRSRFVLQREHFGLFDGQQLVQRFQSDGIGFTL
jgi:hypothetical protein